MPVAEKVEFHHLLLKGVAERDSNTRLGLQRYSRAPENGMPSRGIASEKKSCIYGGWISKMKYGVCEHPYRNRDKVGYDPCGLRGVHRCNPVLFGESDEGSVEGSKPGRGMCVKASDGSSGITWSCMKKAYGSEDGSIDVKRFQEHLKNLGQRDRDLGHYLAMATEIVEEHCTEGPNNFCAKYSQGKTSCKQLKDSFFAKTGADPVLIECQNKTELGLDDLEGELEETFAEVQGVLEIYYPLIEESHAWQRIRQEALVAEQFQENGFWPHSCSPLTILLDNEERLRNGRKCIKRKGQLENELLAETPWGKMSLRERAEEIYRLAKESYRDMVNAADNPVVKSGKFTYKETIDGTNIFHEYVQPELAACVAYHETEGNLHPFRYNNKVCQRPQPPPKFRSKAYGLGQATRKTTRDMARIVDGSNLPLNTPEAQKYFWPGHSEEKMTGEEIYKHLIFSPKYQMELIMRMLNEKAKWEDRKYKNYNFDMLIETYSGGDGGDTYNNHVKNCMKCFREGRKASDCYCELEKYVSPECK